MLKEKAAATKTALKNSIKEINGVNFLATEVDLDPSSIKDLAFNLGKEVPNLFFVAGSINKGKAMLTCYIDKTLVEQKNMDAGATVRELGKFINGGGGGQKFFATAGGKNPNGIADALKAAEELV